MITYIVICFLILSMFWLCFKKEVEPFQTDSGLQLYRSIPPIVYQTYSSYEDLPECVREVMDRNKARNPSYTFKFFDDFAVEQYVRDHTSPKEYFAFQQLNPKCGACRADFFRYVVIYNEGGIYADIKTEFKTPLDDWIHTSSKIKMTVWPWIKYRKLRNLFPKKYRPKSNRYEINQAVIMYPAKHPFLRVVIDEMVERILKKNKKRNDVLSTTGPHMYTAAIAPQLPFFDYEMMEDGDNLYNEHVTYDGTKGCYHDVQRKQKRRYDGLSVTQ